MSTIKFLQGDCLEWMNKISKKGKVVDVVLTSPPYNTSRPNKSDSSLKNHEGRQEERNKRTTTQKTMSKMVIVNPTYQ